MKNWLKKHRIEASLIPVLLVMVLIFWFSAQPGDDSGNMSGPLTQLAIGVFYPYFASLTPEQQTEIQNTVGLLTRKAAHFSEFALLGFLLMLHIRQLQSRLQVALPWLWAWGVGVLYAISDELHQAFVPGRHPAITDVLIDSAGAVAGVALLVLCFWKKQK